MVAISRVGSNMRFSCFSGPIRKQVLWENNKKNRWIKLSKQVCYSCGCQTSREKLHTLNASLLNNTEV